MSYDGKFGSTDIMRRDRELLSISLDYEYDMNKRFPCIAYYPDTNESRHYHINLNRSEAEKLRDWLTGYLNDASSK